MTPDACRSLQIGPHDSRCVQMPPHGSRWLQTSADRSVGSRLQIAPDCCRWLQMNQDASRCLQMAPDSSRWLETTPHDSNSSQMAPDGVKLNIWSCFHYCSQLANCKSANILTVHTCCGKACLFSLRNTYLLKQRSNFCQFHERVLKVGFTRYAYNLKQLMLGGSAPATPQPARPLSKT